MNGAISFNLNSFQTYNPVTKTGIITNSIQHTQLPEKIVALYTKADANGSVIPATNYSNKTITISGAIVGSTQDDLDSRIDTFKSYLVGTDLNLDIDYAGSTRRYIATVNSSSINRQQKGLFAEFSVEFICSQPFGTETAATSLFTQENYTSAVLTETPTISGTSPSQLPIITITIDALTGAGDYVQISNDDNNQQILVYGLGLQAGDVIEINSLERTVRLNDVEVDYSGTFLDLNPGAASITYTDGFDTRTVDIVAEYFKMYL